MAGMNDLMKKYGLKSPAPKPEPSRPEAEAAPVRPPEPDAGQTVPAVPPAGGQRAPAIPGRTPAPEQPQARSAGTPLPEQSQAHSAGTPVPGQFDPWAGFDIPAVPPPGERASGSGRRTMAGTFGGTGGPPAERNSSAGGKLRPFGAGSGFLGGLTDRLPPLWGIDLALTAASLAGLVYIALHWSVILLAIARVIYAIASGLLGICVLLGIGAAALYALRRRR